MKKLISLLLCLTLLASLGLTAAAAGTDSAMNERLTAITLKVKETLGIGDSFTSFSGNLNEYGKQSMWSLNWSSDSEQIYVNANENGAVVNYSYNTQGVSIPVNNRIPRFPAMSLDEAKTIAGKFLLRVLDTKIASVDLNGTSSLDYSGNAVYYLSGAIKLFGTETPVSVSVSVGAATKQVVSFYRSDMGQDYSGVTNPSAATDKAAAAALLKGTLNMKLTYALPGDGTHTARLQYLPAPNGSYVVDASTGKLVDLSKLDWGDDYRYNSASGKAESAAPAASADSGAAITAVEQQTIDKLQGVLSQAELEKTVRAYAELGLTSDFKLQNVNYYSYENDKKETVVTANLQFTYAPQDGRSQFRSVTLDAKTGKLQSVSGTILYKDPDTTPTTYKYTDSQTEAVARSFAGKILPEELKLTVLSKENAPVSDTSGMRNYMFCRAHENVTFPENYISVSVDAETGFVISFYYNWYGYEVTFPSPAGVITADTAAAMYAEAAGTTLGYVSVPTSVQPSGLLLAYTKADTSVWGVDALKGELLKTTSVPDTGIAYDDLGGNPYAPLINKLASFGVGFPGGKFLPDARLTQLDALILIESTTGRKFMPIPLDSARVDVSGVSADSKIAPVAYTSETDDIYSTAYAMGILTPDEKNPSKLVSRAEYVKYLVNALGYQEIAALKGIYDPGFKDDDAIPAGLIGYVAIGRGLGIVNGDNTGRLKPNDTATRTMAAVMLYNCLNRK
jgi:hypothetical protein